jgi:ribosomal-protein-alanine N-acetyltransferase
VTVELSEAGSAAVDEVVAVMNSAFDPRFGEAWTRSQCSGILPMQGVKLTVARIPPDVGLVGFSLYRTVAGDAELLLLAVDPPSRGQGIGTALLDHFIEDAKKSGAKTIHLEVRSGNPAIHIYERAGFHQAGRRRNYYRGADGEQFDALTFVLSSD